MHFWECAFTLCSASTHYHAFLLRVGYEALNSLSNILPIVLPLSFLPSPLFLTPSSSLLSQHGAQYLSIKVKRWMTSIARREREAWAQCTLICLLSECKAGSITQAARRGWGMVALIGLSCVLISKKAKWKHKVLGHWLGTYW